MAVPDVEQADGCRTSALAVRRSVGRGVSRPGKGRHLVKAHVLTQISMISAVVQVGDVLGVASVCCS